MTVTNAFLSERIGSVGGHFANHFFSDSQGGGSGYKETTAGKSLRSVSIVIMIMKIRMMMMMMGTWHEISPYVKSRRFT